MKEVEATELAEKKQAEVVSLAKEIVELECELECRKVAINELQYVEKDVKLLKQEVC